jgi:hypothetical protein
LFLAFVQVTVAIHPLQHDSLTSGLAVAASSAMGVILATKAVDGSLFGYHPALLACGAIVLPVASITRMRSRTHADGSTPAKLHLLLNGVGFTCTLAGCAAVFVAKSENVKPHLTSWHSWAGVAYLAVYSLTALGYAARGADMLNRCCDAAMLRCCMLRSCMLPCCHAACCDPAILRSCDVAMLHAVCCIRIFPWQRWNVTHQEGASLERQQAPH